MKSQICIAKYGIEIKKADVRVIEIVEVKASVIFV